MSQTPADVRQVVVVAAKTSAGHAAPLPVQVSAASVYLEWNKSLVYATTAAYLATRIDGAPKLTVSGKIPSLSMSEMKALQQELARRGYEMGKIDGVLGGQTRLAVRDMQKKLAMPADGYPTLELLQKLRSGKPS